MTLPVILRRALLSVLIAVILSACASRPHVTQVQPLVESADAPYENVLVVALFASFDTRKGLERAIVQELTDRGVKAVASTSMMTTKTPVVRQTFVDMVDELGSDSVLVSHLVDIESKVGVKDANPETTYKVRPTYYFNVWSVNMTEYVEPPFVGVEGTFVLATEMYSVSEEDLVWAIETKSKFSELADQPRPYLVYIEEAQTIGKYLLRDGLIAK